MPLRWGVTISLVRLRLMIGDLPGQFARVATAIGELGGNIVEVQHQSFSAWSPKATEREVTVETRDHDHFMELVAALNAKGFQVRVLGKWDGCSFELVSKPRLKQSWWKSNASGTPQGAGKQRGPRLRLGVAL